LKAILQHAKNFRVKRASSLLAFVIIGVSEMTAIAASPQVAIFIEDGFPTYGGMPSFSPFKMTEALASCGLHAQALSAAELADPAILNTRRITVLIMPYGNTFPRAAFNNLRAFHAADGCLVMNSIPFCHPCDKLDGHWTDAAHNEFFGHDVKGIGTGGFGGGMAKARNPRALVPANHPLGIRAEMLPNDDGDGQWLDPQSFSPEDQVIPLIYVGVPGEWHPAAALIRHQCAEFQGARDVWMGTIAEKTDEAGRFLAEQLLVRGVLWCEFEKGELTQDAFHAGIAELDHVPKPKPLPGDLPFAVTPRNWGDTYLPKSKPPARQIIVVNVEPLSTDERLALTCLQGFTSREQPCIWIQRGSDDRKWLDWHKEKGYIDGFQMATNWQDLFKQFSNSFKGAIIPDAKLYRGDQLAVNVAACENLIVATPELAHSLGLQVKMDLRGRFPTYAGGMRWVWDNYKGQLNHHLCKFMNPSLLRNCTFAYDLQWRGLLFWIAGRVDDKEAGADQLAERRLMAEIFAEMDPNIPVLGFPYGGEGIGIGEGDGVALASRYAKGLVCSDFLGNACVMSGVIVDHLSQPAQAPPPSLDKNSIYISLFLSDGDNENIWTAYVRKYFKDPSFGKFPLAFGMGPAIRELMPAVAQWYYEHASLQTEFIAAVSGVAYISPEDYGVAYADRDRVLSGFLDWTSRAMQPLGMRAVHISGDANTFNAQYASALPFCHSIYAPIGGVSGHRSGDKLASSLSNGMAVFTPKSIGRDGKDGVIRELQEDVGSRRPAFINVCVDCWTFGPNDLARIYEHRDSNMVFVTPAQLAALYHHAKDLGWSN